MREKSQVVMRTDLSYLPAHKQSEINRIVEIICAIAVVEKIILFGSYARNDWVEDKYDEEHYRYQSDIDILVIVETRSESTQAKLEQEIDHQVDGDDHIATPLSVIVHDLEFVNRRLSRAQYFFTDIKKEGILLYDSERHQLKEARELLPEERKKLAQAEFDYYFNEADEFKEIVDFCLSKERLNKAAFLLHQTAERLYTAILLVFTRYKPNTHDLAILKKLVNSLNNELLGIFPSDTPENTHLFKLLRKAYVDARYKPSYKISKEELQQLIERVENLRKIGQAICLKKIESFV